MQQGGGGGGGDDKNSAHILWVIALAFFIGFVIWWQFSEQLKQLFLWIRLGEMQAIVFFVKPFNPDARVIADLAFLKELNTFNISVDAAKYISTVTGKFLRYPIALLFALVILIIYSKHIKLKFQKRHNVNTLRSQEQAIRPHITPVINLDLVNADLNSGPWAMAYTPIQFCQKYKLINVSLAPKDPSILSPGDKFIAELIPSRVSRLFALQLGKLWQDPQNLPLYQQALFAAFIAKGSRDTKKARELLEQVSNSMNGNAKPDFSGVQALWQKHYNSKRVQQLCASHAYVNTVMISALNFAREDGVLASADFLWLKPRNRSLWYILNTAGRQTPFAEASGSYAHWLAEKAIGRSLTVPMIDEASKALKLALAEIIYQPDEAEKEQILAAGEPS